MDMISECYSQYTLLFRVVLDLQKSWEDSIKSSRIPQTVSLLSTSYIIMVHFLQLTKQY